MFTAYTSPWMTEDLGIFRSATRKFLERECVPHLDRWIAQKSVDRAAWLNAGRFGLLCAGIPEQYGGGGGTFAHEAVIAEELEYCGIGMGFGNTVHSGIAAHYILAFGSQEQQRKWLPKLATGEFVAAIAMTEPNAGSDLQSMRATAVREDGAYVINGQKTFITNGYVADLIIVAAKTDPQARAKGVSLLVVETAACPGFSRGRNLDKIGLKASDTAELFFNDARVPVANLLGGVEGQGFTQLMGQLPRERLLLAISAVAAMERAIRLTVAYTKERQAFSQRIIDFQNTGFTLAERKTEAFLGRLLVDHCIQRMMSGDLDTVTASMAKWWCTEKQCVTMDECLQLFGGYGYMAEYPIARMFTDARVQKIYGGTNEIMKLLIARDL